jgi:expansin (peptidoglycan-binding protein)
LVDMKAMKYCQDDPRVVNLIGSPVAFSGHNTYQINASGDDLKFVDYYVTVKGPKGQVRMHVVARYISGRWIYQTLEVNPGNDKPAINLLDKPESIP